MNVWVCVLIFGLLVVIGILSVKVYLLKKTAREINAAFSEKIQNDTNTLIQISSHDSDMRELASSLNMQLKYFNQSRHKFEHGDLELKEAITNISHDLRTPLTAIYGYLKLLQKEECSDSGRTYLTAIENRTEAMKQLTEELFQYTLAVSDTDVMTLEMFLLPRNDQKLLYLTVTKLLVIMTKTNEKEKEIITAQSFDEQQLIITSFVAKSHGYYNKLRAVCQSRRKNYLSES